MSAKYFFALSFLFISAYGFAAENDFELHRLKAQKYIETKDWKSAETEARAMTEADSTNPDGWLMYGIIEQRLEKNDDAAKAYHKYLDLNPPAEKAEAVRSRLAEVETRSEKVKQEVSAENQERYGSRSNGLYIAYAPLYKPSTSEVTGGDVHSAYHLGGQFNRMGVGIMTDSGTVKEFKALPATGNSTVYQKVGPAKLTTWDLYFEFNINLTEPYTSTGQFSFFVPLHMGVFTNSLKLNDGSRTFSNFGMEGASGLGVQWFNRSPITLSLTGLYHWGVGFGDLADTSGTSTNGIQNSAGSPVHGGNVGPELRITLTYLLGYEKSVAEKAGAL
jgi:hypothetical protein